MFQDDYIMREIENYARFLARILFNKKSSTIEVVDEYGNFSSEGYLLYKLREMVSDNDINGAENLLFEEIEENLNENLFHVALLFYGDLSEISEKRLEICNYSKDEIEEGLKEVHKFFNI